MAKVSTDMLAVVERRVDRNSLRDAIRSNPLNGILEAVTTTF